MSKISKQDHELIITKYRDELVPMAQLASHFSVSRHAIYKIIKKAGVDTTKHKMSIACHCCGEETFKARCRVRGRKYHFCSVKCYYAWIDSLSEGPYIKNRNSLRLARSIVSQFFHLQPEHVVHHRDKSNFNNEPSNLMVFSNSKDHIRHHRGFLVQHLWPDTPPAILAPIVG